MEAVVFDFDGVIVDSERLHDQALRQVCAPLGFDWSGDAWVGWPDAEVFIELHRRRGESLHPSRLASLLDAKTAVVLDQVRAGMYHPYAGSLELLREAATRARVGVCSAGLREQIEPVLEAFGVRAVISTIVSFEDTPRSKPDPAPYRLAAERLGVSPARSIALEDSPRGVASAKAAGFTVVALGHTSPRESLAAADHFAPTSAGLTAAMLASLLDARADSD